MADIAYEVSNGAYKVQNGAIQQAFAIAGITVTSVLNGDTATMTLNEDIDDDGVPENTSEFTLSGGEETFELAPFEVKQDNEIWVSFDFTDDGDITDAGRIEDVTFEPSEFILGLTEIQNYLEDDWDDNRLTDRQWRNSDINQGVFAHPDANEAGDTLIGRYRPEWKIDVENTVLDISNKNVKFTQSTNGSNSQAISTSTSYTSGSWKYQIQYTTLGNDGDRLQMNHFSPQLSFNNTLDGNEGYHTSVDDGTNEALILFHIAANDSKTQIINSTWSSDTSAHTQETTRDSYGNWEVYFDGVSQGTATDERGITPQICGFILYGSAGGSVVTADNLVIN